MPPSAGEVAMALQIRAAKLPDVMPEFKFHPTRRWRLDFAWVPQMVALEVEGGTWTRGRHTRGAGFEKDLDKYNEASLAGWLVLRVTTPMVHDGRALDLIERALQK